MATALVEAVRVIVDPVGASSGTLSHEDTTPAAVATRSERSGKRLRRRGIIKCNYLNRMNLRGQHAGYAMAALLVAISVMSVVLAVVMPVWTQMARREKEAELIFRGEQYKRALELFQRRNGPGVTPPSVDLLVEQKFLRKAYRDPITGDDFVLLRQAPSNAAPGPASPAAPAGRGATPAAGVATRQSAGSVAGGVVGGIVGVASSSTDESLRIYNGRTHYNEWDFTFVQQTQAPGASGRGGPGVPAQGAPGVGGPPAGRGSGMAPTDGREGRGRGPSGLELGNGNGPFGRGPAGRQPLNPTGPTPTTPPPRRR